jgi:hypothetical protein
MLNLVEQPGFDYGYPNPNPKFGLWCPLFDCFLMVGHDYNILSEVQLLTSSKLITNIVELILPESNVNIIDNEVCSSWTILDSELINFTLVFKKTTSIPKFSIIHKDLDNSEEVNKIQAWFIFVSHWVTQLHNMSVKTRTVTFINSVMNIGPADQIKQKIYKILLLGEDIDTVNNQINQVI